ncbi:MAG: cytoplasmic protein [Deltaproteobacteria bacterium]|nr:cytoplasmic protein [Deltaproteobacteria bacterium]MBW2051863.1 cytoplasmic protein [Deltaproteobacteria bacterium]MBW2141219.1 cytoplasmic protein [Deltaproteobacteria bacterium]
MTNRIPRNPLRNKENSQTQYDQFDAIELYCPICKRSMPVRKRLLLILPEGDKYEYLCARCGTSVGEKIDKNTADQNRLII